MYRHCVFCAADLGANEVIESFPVGRRLAFDPAKGRLWAICRACTRWNLTPLEERWEAIDEAERIFRVVRTRVSTGQIGLARHREGLDLVRIGAPQRPEFAAWRYGDRFGKRRRRYVVNAAVGAGAAAGLLAGSAAVIGGTAALHLLHIAFQARRALHPAIRIHRGDEEVLHVRALDLNRITLWPTGVGGAPDAPWELTVPHRGGKAVLTGREGVRALGKLLPAINRSGARQGTVQDAVAELEEVGGPEPYFTAAEGRARRQGKGWMPLSAHPREIRLALEMAAHEDQERVALEGELVWLEAAWREAEEIAAIADDLALPERVRIRLEELKARYGR